MGESYMQRARGRWDVKFVALSMIFVLGGCAIYPHPVCKKQLATVVQRDRDEEDIRRATDSVTGAPSLANPYISSERRHVTSDVTFSWSVLDFGASYYAAKQQADRVLIASERRRKSMHNLIQNVRSAYWRAIAAEKLQTDVKASIKEAEAALANSQRVESERVKAPVEALRYQRALLENLRLLENVDRALASARIELAGFIGLSPGTRYTLVEPTGDQSKLAPLEIPVEQ